MTTQKTLANAIRFLSMDAVQKAKSGHPGMPMGMADIATVLWQDFLSHNPNNPQWVNRDRFVISNGHGSMLLYSLLHLTGYDLSIEELQNFRQLHSKTPGHPEHGETPGVETTTGPLGQGLANAVGMALAEKKLAAEFNRENFPLIHHYTYAFVGDGCLMEGVSHEACALAGTFGLHKLIVFWDDNGISIDGKVEGWFTDNTPERFKAYHWNVITDVNGHDTESIKRAITQAQQEKQRPTLICCKTNIGEGSPNKAKTSDAHGSPLGDAEIALSREQLGWSHVPFVIPEEIYQAWDAKKLGNERENTWKKLLEQYQQQYPELAKELNRRIQRKLPEAFITVFEDLLSQANASQKSIATRQVNKQVLEKIIPMLPELLGGSADLSISNETLCSHTKSIQKDNWQGNYIHYGVREFGMSAIMNGIAVYGGFIPFGGTFLIFSSYCANAIRMSALMKQRVIYVLTHDSIGLGEDGPTHQPIEQLAMLRAIPNLLVFRPCDAMESIIAWEQALAHQHNPSCLLLSRQALPFQIRDEKQIQLIKRGAYILFENNANPEFILMATGSEIKIAMAAAKVLAEQHKKVRVISMPCVELFKQQEHTYQESLLPMNVTKRIAIEAANGDFWYQFVGLRGAVIDLQTFGLSAPADQIYKELGLTAERVVDIAGRL
jgi:transketolase